MTRVVPPMTRRWFEALPPPYNTEGQVVAMRLPRDWTIKEAMTKDEKFDLLVALSPDMDQCKGLQVIDSKKPSFRDQSGLFNQYGIKPADPSWVGPIGNLPQWLLLDEEAQIILFVRDKMWRAPINLTRLWKPSGLKC